jgi:hypothetical protein
VRVFVLHHKTIEDMKEREGEGGREREREREKERTF